MEYNEVKQNLLKCPEITSLDEHSTSALFWHGSEETLQEGAVIYEDGASLDDTFCALLSGSLIVEKAGQPVGQITGNQIFGEMAYFTRAHSRTATVRVSSPEASVLRVKLSRSELDAPRFSALRKYLGLEAWDRFVSSSQS